MDKKPKAAVKNNRIRFVGVFILTVVLITIINLYKNCTACSMPIEDEDPISNYYIIKIEPDNIDYSQLFALKSPIAFDLTGIIEPSATVQADVTTEASVEDDLAGTIKVTDDKALIAYALNHWSNAWSNQRVEEYMLVYHDDFQPAQNLKKQSWIKDRWLKITRPEWIKVIISEMEIDLLSEDRARVLFKQRYESPNYQDTVLKIIHMVKTGTHWKIISEESVTR